MGTRVTIQDIADSLGISRNTVSKAINNTGILADATRERILKKAVEMGYKQFSYTNLNGIADLSKTSEEAQGTENRGEIALFTTAFLGNSHFSSLTLDKFQREISQLGYSFSMYRILSDEIKTFQLPSAFDKERAAGIICIEMFDYDYSRMLCELDLPVLFVDTPVIGLKDPLKADCLYMNNQAHIYTFIREMVSRGKKRIGFVGEQLHCQSFFERYMAYRNGMYLSGLPCPEEFCITEAAGNGQEYRAYLKEKMQVLKELPDVFICANDFIALDLLIVFRDLGISVPGDVYLCGFDDSPESKLVSPSLTTIHIHTQILGYSAAQLLLSRIKQPSLDYRTVYAETDIIYRESTEG